MGTVTRVIEHLLQFNNMCRSSSRGINIFLYLYVLASNGPQRIMHRNQDYNFAKEQGIISLRRDYNFAKD